MTTHRVFVYGSLMAGFHNHGLLFGNRPNKVVRMVGDREQQFEVTEKAVLFRGHSNTIEPAFTMMDLGRFPAVVRTDIGQRILGEVYSVDTFTLAALDTLEGHPRFYQRHLTEIEGHGTCWMYVMPMVKGMKCDMIVPSGSWRAYCKINKPDLIAPIVPTMEPAQTEQAQTEQAAQTEPVICLAGTEIKSSRKRELPTIVFTEVGETYQVVGKYAAIVSRMCDVPLDKDSQTAAVPCQGWRPRLAALVNAGYKVRLEANQEKLALPV